MSFNNHVFEYKCFDNKIEYLACKDPEYEWKNRINYLFDRSSSTLSISGDFGFAVFCWYSSQNPLRDIAEYSKDLGYFASKVKAAEFDPDYWENLPDGKVISDWIRDYASGLQKWLDQDTKNK